MDRAHHRLGADLCSLQRHSLRHTCIIGPTLFVTPNLNDRLAVALYCPGAEAPRSRKVPIPPPPTPNGTQGHTVEITCYFPDGSTDIIDNGEYAIASIGGMFGDGILIGLVISLPLMFLPFLLIRRKKS